MRWVKGGGGAAAVHAGEHQIVKTAEPCAHRIVAKRDGETDSDPHQRNHAHGGERHHHGVQHAFAARQPAVEKRQRRCHQ